MALVHERLGTMELMFGRADRALDHYLRSLELRTLLADERPRHADALRDVAVAYEKAGDLQMATGDASAAPKALPSYQRAVETFEAMAEADPDEVSAALSLAISLEKLAQALTASGEPSEALTHRERALAIWKKRELARDP